MREEKKWWLMEQFSQIGRQTRHFLEVNYYILDCFVNFCGTSLLMRSGRVEGMGCPSLSIFYVLCPLQFVWLLTECPLNRCKASHVEGKAVLEMFHIMSSSSSSCFLK